MAIDPSYEIHQMIMSSSGLKLIHLFHKTFAAKSYKSFFSPNLQLGRDKLECMYTLVFYLNQGLGNFEYYIKQRKIKQKTSVWHKNILKAATRHSCA